MRAQLGLSGKEQAAQAAAAAAAAAEANRVATLRRRSMYPAPATVAGTHLPIGGERRRVTQETAHG